MRGGLLATGLTALVAGLLSLNLSAQSQASSSSCDDPVDQRPAGGTCVSTVNGTVVDDSGAPLPNLRMSVCAGTCYYGKTDADGTFTVKVYSHLVIEQYATSVHGGPDYVAYYAPLPGPSRDTYTYGAAWTLPRLPASGPEIATDGSAQRITAGGVTLHLAAGTTVDIGLDDRMLGPIGSQLRPVTIANPKAMPFVDSAAPPTLLYGFAPFEVRFSHKTPVSFANTSGLPAGTAVEVRSMSGLVADGPPAGRFWRVASAHVSADGARIDMDPGEGVSGLTWLALFPR